MIVAIGPGAGRDVHLQRMLHAQSHIRRPVNEFEFAFKTIDQQTAREVGVKGEPQRRESAPQGVDYRRGLGDMAKAVGGEGDE